MEKIKIASYQRISKGENVDESIVVQKLILEKYAKDNDIEFIGNYVDIHKQTIEDRPEYNRLVKDIFEGKIDELVIVGGLDRLSRNMSVIDEFGYYVKMECIFPKLEYYKPCFVKKSRPLEDMTSNKC